ncbi:response regulator transcription factor [Streptomyces sp. NPDC048445]|uniref:response regulator transcription factor n=1 Tax=Streptomyces sp. NPDC048445 TaxID=3365553 RepID=UPI003720B849
MTNLLETSIRTQLLIAAETRDLDITTGDIVALTNAALTAAAAPALPGKPVTLTNQQTGVLVGLALGDPVTETARRMCLSVHTVKTHRRTLYKTLGAHTGAQAVSIAMSLGLLRPQGGDNALPLPGQGDAARNGHELPAAAAAMGARPMPVGKVGLAPAEQRTAPQALEKTTPTGAEVTAAVATARTVVLTALARVLREHPTAGRVLDGLGELGEAVVCEDLAEVRSWVDGISLLAGLPTVPDTGLTFYRASHESIVVGRYTTEAVARRHCESLLSNEHPATRALIFDWIGDEDDPEEPRELVVQIDGGDEQPTGYVVQELRIEAEFDPDAE